MSASNIVLIGFMGSGKSSVARAFAAKTKYYFLDTDALIETSQGKCVAKIFEDKNEEYFRSLEKETAEWLFSSVKEAIISTGGGMISHCDILNKLGKVFYLKVPFETIMQRMNKQELDKRPLFKNKEKAFDLYTMRDTTYTEKADVIIDANTSIEKIVIEIQKSI
ncbi:AAA family ATPase [Sulfurimonas sp. MAG313]|nr:AAA family ATPase [Sulfurimonas sp. MAG313]